MHLHVPVGALVFMFANRNFCSIIFLPFCALFAENMLIILLILLLLLLFSHSSFGIIIIAGVIFQQTLFSCYVKMHSSVMFLPTYICIYRSCNWFLLLASLFSLLNCSCCCRGHQGSFLLRYWLAKHHRLTVMTK